MVSAGSRTVTAGSEFHRPRSTRSIAQQPVCHAAHSPTPVRKAIFVRDCTGALRTCRRPLHTVSAAPAIARTITAVLARSPGRGRRARLPAAIPTASPAATMAQPVVASDGRPPLATSEAAPSTPKISWAVAANLPLLPADRHRVHGDRRAAGADRGVQEARPDAGDHRAGGAPQDPRPLGGDDGQQRHQHQAADDDGQDRRRQRSRHPHPGHHGGQRRARAATRPAAGRRRARPG